LDGVSVLGGGSERLPISARAVGLGNNVSVRSSVRAPRASSSRERERERDEQRERRRRERERERERERGIRTATGSGSSLGSGQGVAGPVSSSSRIHAGIARPVGGAFVRSDIGASGVRASTGTRSSGRGREGERGRESPRASAPGSSRSRVSSSSVGVNYGGRFVHRAPGSTLLPTVQRISLGTHRERPPPQAQLDADRAARRAQRQADAIAGNRHNQPGSPDAVLPYTAGRPPAGSRHNRAEWGSL